MNARASIGEETFSLHLRAHKIGFDREYYFHPKRKWRFDFAFLERKIAVEIEGGTWINGRHNRGSSIAKDFEKYNAAASLGWLVYRFTTDMVMSGEAIEMMRGEV
jgi:hypothetical protein